MRVENERDKTEAKRGKRTTSVRGKMLRFRFNKTKLYSKDHIKQHFFLKKLPLANDVIMRKWHQKKWILRIHKMADIGEKKVKA